MCIYIYTSVKNTNMIVFLSIFHTTHLKKKRSLKPPSSNAPSRAAVPNHVRGEGFGHHRSHGEKSRIDHTFPERNGIKCPN